MELLGEEIMRVDPDIIGLQEVTSTLFPLIVLQPWARKYYITEVNFPKLGILTLRFFFFQIFFLIYFFFSKFRPKNLSHQVLPSRTGKFFFLNFFSYLFIYLLIYLIVRSSCFTSFDLKTKSG